MKSFLFYDTTGEPAIVVLTKDCWKALAVAHSQMYWHHYFTPWFRQVASFSNHSNFYYVWS